MHNLLKTLIDLFLHLDKNLALIISHYGAATYLLMFGIIFMETGFVVTPFLPGDALLFASGALSAAGILSIWVTYALFLVAAVLGDTVNYWIGHFVGPKIFDAETGLAKGNKFIKKEYLDKTQTFYAKHGNMTIILARFVPIVRTFAPFVAGIAKMSYKRFITYNIVGGFLWVTIFTWTGFFFGNLPFVKANFEFIVVFIILLSIVPILYEWIKSLLQKKAVKS